MWRKDLGYYVGNIDNPYWDPKKKQMRHRYTMVGKSQTEDRLAEFGPKYRARMAKKKVVDP